MFQLIALKNAFYPQAGIGISANSVLLSLHISMFSVGPKPKLTDLTVTHLAVVHIVMLLTMGLLLSKDLWGARDAQSNIWCKVIVFLNKLMRGLSIATTGLLSTLQAITISPSSSWLAQFKCRSPHFLLCFSLFIWALTSCICSNLLLYTVAAPNETQPGLLFLTDHCSFLPMSSVHRALFFTLMTFRDVFFIGLMAVSSGYMTLVLYRHARRSQHLHSLSCSPRSSPEKRATKTILLLVSCFVIGYCVDIIISVSTGTTWTNDPILVCIQILVSHGYCTVSPLVLIRADKHIIEIMQNIWERNSNWLRKFI
ncbi:vomeronasal 1 receptor oryCunV1R1524 [Oryctolagus cuniculus]|uniref:Vomeronasal type-1 receptor n=1 Tax=Oryctolagus cuniculus TaxID=9986 RepID=G1TH56_RABIT|nr:vomeronasal 1 receptor oryCunV1R1524 [Oryctolagus cuniculus]